MKAKFKGEEVNVLVLNKVEIFGIEEGFIGSILQGNDDLPQAGVVYLYGDGDCDEETLKAVHRVVREIAKSEGRSFPPLSKIPDFDWTINGFAKYHLTKDDDGASRVVFDDAEPLSALYEINENGEFVEYVEEPEESVDEMRKHWQDFLIPIPPPPKNATDELYLPMAYEPYDWIKEGSKTTEFRDYTENWVKKILAHPIKTVRFQRGYGGPGRPEPEQMVWTVKRIYLYEYDAKIECEPGRTDVPIVPDYIAIDLGERVDGTNADASHEEPVAKTEDNAAGNKKSDNPLIFVDIGEVKSIVGISPTLNKLLGATVDVKACGERGDMEFSLLSALSRGRVETENGQLWTLPLAVTLESLSRKRLQMLEPGEEIRLPSLKAAIKMAKDLGFENLEDLMPKNGGRGIEWADSSDSPTVEPEWFRQTMRCLGIKLNRIVPRKTVEFYPIDADFFASDDGFNGVVEGSQGVFYTGDANWEYDDFEVDFPCIYFPYPICCVISVPWDAAQQILEGRRSNKLQIVARSCYFSKEANLRVEIIEGAESYQSESSEKINAILGDITKFEGDAIVNAANERMLGGGGVDGAIHRAAGPRLLAECEKVPEVRPGVRCPTGEARITPGGNLKAKWVIHTVGPVYRDGQQGEPEKLASCYRNSLQLAADNSIKSIAFPSISTGVYGYPVEEAAAIAVREVRNFLSEHPDMSVTFVCFNGPRDKMDVKAVYDKLIGAVPGADVKQEATVSAEPSAKSAAEEDTKRAKNAYQSAIGSLGSSKRWGENHGPTVTVRAFAPVAERLRKLVPEKDRARFVTDALEAKLNELEETGAGEGGKLISRALFNWLEILAARIAEVIDAYNAGNGANRLYFTLIEEFSLDIDSVRNDCDYAAYLEKKYKWLITVVDSKSEIDEEGRKKLPKPIERVVPFSPRSFPNTKIKDSSITSSTLRDRNHRGAFDYLVELRQITYEAAETINANVGQIAWLGYGCGAVKKFFAVLDHDIPNLHTLKIWSTQCDFAAEILRVVLQIFESREKDYQMAVDLIEPYSPERYPGTRKLAEAAEAAGYAEEGEQS